MTTKQCRCSPRRSPPKPRAPPEDDKGVLIRLLPSSPQQLERLNRLKNPAAVSGDNAPQQGVATCHCAHVTQSTLRVQDIHQHPDPPPGQFNPDQFVQPFLQQPLQQAFQPFQQPLQRTMLPTLPQQIQQPFQQVFGTVPSALCQPVPQFVPQFLSQDTMRVIPQTFVQTVPQSTITHLVPQAIAQPVFQQMSAPQSTPVSVQNLPPAISVTAIANAIRASNDESEKRAKRKHSCCCLGQHNHCNLQPQPQQNNNQPTISIPPYALLGDLMARAMSPQSQPPAPSNITLSASVAMPKGKESDTSLQKERPKRKKKRRKKSTSSSSSSSSEHKKKEPPRELPVKQEPPRELPVLPVELPPPEPQPERPSSLPQYEEHEHDIYHQEQIPVEYTSPQMLVSGPPPAGGPEMTAEMPMAEEEANPMACTIVIVVVVSCFMFCLLCVIYPSIVDWIFGLDAKKGGGYSRQLLRLDVEAFVDGLQRMGDNVRKHLPGSRAGSEDVDFEKYIKGAWKREQ